jgi:hypothetical protein
MAKTTRIPELVVGKIYIDGGSKDKVYTIGSDSNGALRIGDSKSNMVATIDQKTGKIVANSFAGDGSALQGISAEGLAELQTAKLLTLSTDTLFFKFDADGAADPATQEITLTANTQNITNPTYNWFIDGQQVSSTGATKTINLATFGNSSSMLVTVEVDNESLSESVTLLKLQAGATGKDAVTVSMSNPTVTYQSDSSGDIDETDNTLMEAGQTDITVRYGATKLTPVTGTPGDGEFTVTVAGSEYVDIPEDPNNPGAQDPAYIAPDTANNKMDIDHPANVTAAVGTVTFLVSAQVDGETYDFTQIQTFNLTIPGATGDAAKFVKLTSDDYQFAYNSDGLQADPAFVTLTASAQNHDGTAYYRWFVDDVPWNPGTAGTAYANPSQHLYSTTNTMRLNAASSHTAFGFKKVVRVETQTTDDGDPIASDSVSIIATKDGSNAIQIAADNLTHGFPANADGTIDSSDYDDGAITFQVYHGNTNMTPNMTIVGNLQTLIQGTTIGTSPTQTSINNIVANLSDGEFAVLADATTATVNNVDVNTIDPFGSSPQSVTDASGANGVKFFPNSMQTSLRRAAINYSFYLRTADGQLAATTVRTQTFVKGRDGPQGNPGVGVPGTDAKATKLILDDYQVGFDENGGNPQTAAGSGIVNASTTVQGMRTNFTFIRVYLDNVQQSVQNATGAPWETYGWRKAPAGLGSYQFDFSGETYDTDWSAKKKVVKIEATEIDYTYDSNTNTYTVDSEDINGNAQDVTNLPILAQDSETIIATKEGSNALEVFGNNLSHQFIQDTNGQIDYSGGGITFNAYIGNEAMTAYNGLWENAPDKSFRVVVKDLQNITNANGSSVFGGSFILGAPRDMTDTSGSITWGIQVIDSTGTERPERELVQTFTKVRDGSDSKLIRIDASSTIFSFDSDMDWASEPSEITFSVPSQNLAQGEEITVDDITFIDKNGVDVSALIKTYINPPLYGALTTEQLIAADLAQGSTFTMRFAQFQPISKDDNGAYFSSSDYTNPQGDTIENVAIVLQQLKKSFPITVKVTKTGLAGAVSTISDELRVLSLQGGSSAINIDAPNAVHLFDANSDMEVDNGQASLDAAGTDVDVYVGNQLLVYDSAATSMATLERGKYRFDSFIYGTKAGTGSGGNMITLAIRSDYSGIEVTNVATDYTKQTVTLPIQIKRSDGTEETKNLILSYSKVREGRDGENLKDRNFDFSQGATGWSLDAGASKGTDMTLTEMKTIPDDDAVFGSDIGKFMGYEFEDADPATSFRTQPVWLSEALPVGGTGEADVDEGVWVIKFRARAPQPSSALNSSSSPCRLWLMIRPYAADGSPYPYTTNDDQMIYFDSLPTSSTGYTSDKTFFGGQLKYVAGQSSSTVLSMGINDLDVPIMTSYYITYIARIKPGDIRELYANASSFKIGFMYKDSDMASTSNGERTGLYVDAFQAEKIPYSGIQAFDSEQFDRIQNNKLLADTANAGVQLVKNTQEDMTLQTSVAVNGKFKIRDSFDLPANVCTINFNNTTGLGNHARSDSVWKMFDDDGDYMRIKGYSTSYGRRRGILFPAVAVPENHYVEVSLKYKGGYFDSSGDKALVRAWQRYSIRDC